MLLSMVIYSPWEVPQINVNINRSGIFVSSRREERITKIVALQALHEIALIKPCFGFLSCAIYKIIQNSQQ